ncbi:DUF2946 domain-containing protein [Pantoea deleyi]|uniref:DUF2946 domain-containing protein n=1 Tax=Pantoea deleyi TaxID=470932 RepID=UPI000FE1449F|nr:DUF2946 domain-containing protein [Pantoea deleyi]
MPRSSLRQRLTACIAILAVLLLFVAPMISKNLAAHHAMMADRPGMSAMSAEMPMMHHHGEMPMADPAAGDMGFACGYCDLLVHVPLMLWVFIPFIWWMCLISRAPPAPGAPPSPRRRRQWRLNRPRAPPFLRHTHR